MESFYGGRQGASFVVVARYKTIAEMCEVFAQGGTTTSDVNYGEYVIIDSLIKNNTDNGKVFRRGMNYSQTATAVAALWTDRKSEVVTSAIEDLVTSTGLTEDELTEQWETYDDNYKLINSIILDWDEFKANYNDYAKIDGFLVERSTDLYNYYVSLYAFERDTDGIITITSGGANETAIENYRTIKNRFDDLRNLVDWEAKKYCTSVDNGYVYAGAEYIGQIIGPQGTSPIVKLDDYDTVVDYIKEKQENPPDWYDPSEDGKDVYNTSQPIDLLPGKDSDGNFNDDINYAWVTMRDTNGNITGCNIGFKIPYLVIEYSGYSLSPYDEAGTATASYDSTSRTWSYTDLVQRDDDETHPFYQHHNVYIPKGIKGDTWTNLRKVSITYNTTERYFIYKANTGASKRIHFWDDTTSAIVADDGIYWDSIKGESGNTTRFIYCNNDGSSTQTIPETAQYVASFDEWIKYTDPTITDTDGTNITNSIKMFDDSSYSILATGFTKTKNIYLVDYHNYDGSATGEKTIYYVGNDNTLNDVNVDSNGSITIKYNYDDTDVFYNRLTWIQTLVLMENGDIWWEDNRGNSHKITDVTFGWLKGMKVDPDSGDVTYYWNHEGDFWTNGIQQHTQTITDEDDNTCYITIAEGQFQMLKEFGINSVKSDGSLDYDQDQKVWYRLNNDAEDVKNEIGAPLNYVAEALITDNTHTNIAGGHLLMYFSDPALRSKLAEEGKTVDDYPSLRLTDETSGEASLIDGWYDAGTVSASYGLQIYSYGTDNPDDATPPPSGKEGWGYGKTTDDGTILYLYDYVNNKWVQVGKISNNTSGMHVAMEESVEGSTPADIIENGLWFVEEDQLAGDVTHTGKDWIVSDDIYKYMFNLIN